MNENRLIPFESDRNFFSLREAMNQLFDESLWSPFSHSQFNHFSKSMLHFPKVDISETEKSIIVTANVPGIASEDISIDISDNVLTISGQTSKQHTEGKISEKYYKYERESGSFSRSFSLPTKIDEDNINAETKNGVLTITLPKLKEETKKKIQIKVT